MWLQLFLSWPAGGSYEPHCAGEPGESAAGRGRCRGALTAHRGFCYCGFMSKHLHFNFTQPQCAFWMVPKKHKEKSQRAVGTNAAVLILRLYATRQHVLTRRNPIFIFELDKQRNVHTLHRTDKVQEETNTDIQQGSTHTLKWANSDINTHPYHTHTRLSCTWFGDVFLNLSWQEILWNTSNYRKH